MSEVAIDLIDLAEGRLPPKSNRFGRNVVKLTIFLVVLMFVTAIGAVTFALYASLQRESNLKESLSCVRASAVEFDRQVGNGISVVIDNQNGLMRALQGVADSDENMLQAEVARFPALTEAGQVSKASLDKAVAARDKAIAECT